MFTENAPKNNSKPTKELFGYGCRGIFSIYQMLNEFDLVRVHHGLENLQAILRVCCDEMQDTSYTAIPSRPQIALLASIFEKAEYGIRPLAIGRIPSVIDSISELLNQDQPVFRGLIQDSIQNLISIVKHEMQSAVFYQLPREDVKYLQQDAISNDVRTEFPDCVFDLAEAHACFAYDRITACIYHCMCVLEHVFPSVVAKANKLGVQYTPAGSFPDTWGVMLDKLDAEIKRLQQIPKASRNAASFQRLSELCSYVRALKVAWRDPTMHARGQFNNAVARSVLQQTSDLLDYLATTL